MSSQLDWWGYLHTNGSIQVKRYFDVLDLCEARESPFVQSACGPFPAKDRDDAIKKVTKILKPGGNK